MQNNPFCTNTKCIDRQNTWELACWRVSLTSNVLTNFLSGPTSPTYTITIFWVVVWLVVYTFKALNDYGFDPDWSQCLLGREREKQVRLYRLGNKMRGVLALTLASVFTFRAWSIVNQITLSPILFWVCILCDRQSDSAQLRLTIILWSAELQWALLLWTHAVKFIKINCCAIPVRQVVSWVKRTTSKSTFEYWSLLSR